MIESTEKGSSKKLNRTGKRLSRKDKGNKFIFRIDEESKLVYNPEKPRRTRIVAISVLAFFVASILSVLGLILWSIFFYTGVYPNVTFSGVPIGGMSKVNAQTAIQRVLDNYVDDILEIRYEDHVRSISVLEAGSVISEKEALTTALQIGRTGTTLQRIRTIAQNTLFGVEVLAEGHADQQRVLNILTEFDSFIARDRIDGTYAIRGDTIEIKSGITGQKLDVEKAVQDITDQLQMNNFETIQLENYVIFDEALEINLLELHQSIHVSPENAQLDMLSDEVSVIPHVSGVTFDLQAAEKLLSETTAGGTILHLPLICTEPEVTTEAFKALLFRDVLAQSKTTLNAANLNRTGNVRLSASEINGKILMPGEVFSYNETVGERTYERGFKDASVYVSSGIEDQLGGGICQTSSTLYMSIIRAQLEIVERYNHSYTVVYAPLGEDATVYWGSLDFKFANNLEMPIKIVAFQEKDYVVVKLLGTKTNENIVKIETVVLDHIPYSTSTVPNPELAYGVTVQKVEGHSAYRVETYRVVYDAQGNEIERVKLPNSRYRQLNRVLEVGTKNAPAVSPKPTVESTTDPTASPPSPTHTPTPSVSPTPTPPASTTPIADSGGAAE